MSHRQYSKNQSSQGNDTQKFLDDINMRCNTELNEEVDRILEETLLKGKTFERQLREVEEELRVEKSQNSNYFKALEMLEKANEKLREQNQKLKDKNRHLKKKLEGAEKQIELAQKEAATGKLKRKIKPSTEQQGTDKILQGIQSKLLKDANDASIIADDNELEVTLNEINISLEENKENNVSFAWIKRLRLVKEKLMNVQTRCRDLEFLMETQKNLLAAANQNKDKLKEENQELQANQEKMKSDFAILNETRLKEKAKIDNIITFCDLVNNCSFSREELLDKLSEIPMTISLFLKGSSDTLSLKSGDFSFKTGGCDNELVEHFGEKCEEPREKSVEEMSRELEELKQTLNYVAKFVSQAFPSDDQSVLANLEKISQLKLTLKEGLETEADEPSICYNPNSDASKANRCRKRRTICKDHIFARAIQNSSSLFWNLKVNQRGRHIHTNASTNTSMTVLEVEK